MIPTYPYSLSSSPMPFIDLNEDQTHQASSSSSSLSFNPILLNPHDQDHAGSYFFEPKPLQTDHEEAAKIVPYSGSWDNLGEEKDERKRGLKLRVWKKGAGDRDDENLNHQGDREEDDSGKWMPSKMRMMRKMMVSDQTGCDASRQKFEDHIQKQQSLSPLGTDNSSSNSSPISNSNNITVRVCADCHTTKTPLWRSGPRGPKSLCNACGIRQRKARRAMAAAAATSANGAVMAVERSSVKGNKLHRKEKKNSKIELKKKRKLDHDGEEAKPSSRKQFGFVEDFTISLSKNLAPQVFPQDEKEAAILLMALSCGLVHG